MIQKSSPGNKSFQLTIHVIFPGNDSFNSLINMLLKIWILINSWLKQREILFEPTHESTITPFVSRVVPMRESCFTIKDFKNLTHEHLGPNYGKNREMGFVVENRLFVVNEA